MLSHYRDSQKPAIYHEVFQQKEHHMEYICCWVAECYLRQSMWQDQRQGETADDNSDVPMRRYQQGDVLLALPNH